MQYTSVSMWVHLRPCLLYVHMHTSCSCGWVKLPVRVIEVRFLLPLACIPSCQVPCVELQDEETITLLSISDAATACLTSSRRIFLCYDYSVRPITVANQWVGAPVGWPVSCGKCNVPTRDEVGLCCGVGWTHVDETCSKERHFVRYFNQKCLSQESLTD